MSKAIAETKIGSLRATIWENYPENGGKILSVALKKSFKEKDGNWKNSEPIYLLEGEVSDLLSLASALNNHLVRFKEPNNDNTFARLIRQKLSDIFGNKEEAKVKKETYLKNCMDALNFTKEYKDTSESEKNQIYTYMIKNEDVLKKTTQAEELQKETEKLEL